jgi:hypothetical protein
VLLSSSFRGCPSAPRYSNGEKSYYPVREFNRSLVFDAVFRAQTVHDEVVSLDGDVFRNQVGEILPDNPQCSGMKSGRLFDHEFDLRF